MNDGTLSPVTFVSVDNIQVDSYFPVELLKNGTCLIMALLMIFYKNNPYHLDYMLIRKSALDMYTEPLRYTDGDNLILKDICQDVERQFDGSFGNIYVQMMDNETNEIIGISFWQEKKQERSFSIAYHVDSESKKKLPSFTKQVYLTFVLQMEQLLQKLELPEIETDMKNSNSQIARAGSGLTI
ncbi:hypothetical protein [Lacrimispora amygdalina]|uniref:hypothetical protein n=1 Tax=Lacrimispora amygdalina TaxID=253257 RepID=UPI000BE32FE9|nr:hypothetical protein [Lacrimispora amygdalina]